MDNHFLSDEYLNSFIDNQLDPAEKMHAFDTINNNESLKVKVCDLRSLKELVKHAYSQPPGLSLTRRQSPRGRGMGLQALAASLLLFIGGISGWMTHSWSSHEYNKDIVSIVHDAQHPDAVTSDIRKIIIHVNNSSPAKLKTAMDETESLLTAYKHANRQIQLEFIANQKGVDLMRTNVSTYKTRIALMQEQYPNLSFMVCGKTINKLRNNGENVQLLPHIGIATSAADQIGKRMHQGWGYIKI